MLVEGVRGGARLPLVRRADAGVDSGAMIVTAADRHTGAGTGTSLVSSAGA